MIKIEVKNIDNLAKKLDELGKTAKQKYQQELNAFADDVVTDAKGYVSTQSSNEGNLLRSIHPVYGNMKVSIVASASYAAYIEFGTRKYAAAYVSSLPDTWDKLASTFKGSGEGNFKQFLSAIMEWCRKKGIDEKAAYPIAMKILINGIRPKPYLYPSVNNNYPDLIKRIEKIIK